MKYYIVSNHIPEYQSFGFSLYKMIRKGAEKYAHSINRKLAEGPSQLISDNYFGPVELWPLVVEEGEDNSFSRETAPSICGGR